MKILDVIIMIQDGFGKLSAGLLMVEKRLGQIEGFITNGDFSRMKGWARHRPREF